MIARHGIVVLALSFACAPSGPRGPVVVAPVEAPETPETLEVSAQAPVAQTPHQPDEVREPWTRQGGFWRWTWPETADFQAVWRGWGEDTVAARVVTTPDAVFVMHRGDGDAVEVEVIVPHDALASGAWEVLEAPALGEVGRLVLRSTEGRFEAEEAQVGEALTWHRAAYDDWVYTTTLLGFEGDAYAPYAARWDMSEAEQAASERLWEAFARAQEPDPAAAGDAARALVGGGVASDDDRWEGVLIWARAMKDTDLLLAAHARFRPMGRCSMDSRPQEVARAYAKACMTAGRLGCHLQQTVRIMGDRFDRVAWSSYGEQAHDTGAGALLEAGVDEARFLRGLALHYDTARPAPIAVGLWRLARAAVELGQGARFAAQMEAYATDASLDGYNRLRATIALTYTWLREGLPTEAVVATLETMPLSPAAARWAATGLED